LRTVGRVLGFGLRKMWLLLSVGHENLTAAALKAAVAMER
jgi:hypothetical protein